MIFFSLVHSKVCFAVALHLTVGAVSRGESIACAAAGRGGELQQRHAPRHLHQQAAASSAAAAAATRGSRVCGRCTNMAHDVFGTDSWFECGGSSAVDSIETLCWYPLDRAKNAYGTAPKQFYSNDCLRFCGFCHKRDQPSLPLRLTTKTEPNYGASKPPKSVER